MEIVGGGRLHVFSTDDERPHVPSSHANWQESFVLGWFDAEQLVGGLFRVAIEPNHLGGRTQVLNNVFTPMGVFHRTAHLPLEPRHRLPNGLISGDDTLRYEYDGKIHWKFDNGDIQMILVVDEFVPPVDGHRRDNIEHGAAEAWLGAHVDAACRVSGNLTFKGTTYRINNALAVRDHAWGPRTWSTLLAHRWTAATFDRENSFIAMSFLSTGNPLSQFGWVIRDGKAIFANEIDIRAVIGMDGATNLGGVTRLVLTTGEVLEASFDPYYPCIASSVYSTTTYDTLCRTKWGDKVGFGIFETSANIHAGTQSPGAYVGSYGPDGWYDVRL